MPYGDYYTGQAGSGGGTGSYGAGGAGGTGAMGWSIITSSTSTSSYVNPFFGATGGTNVTTATVAGRLSGTTMIDEAEYQRQIQEYNARIMAQEHARAYDRPRGHQPSERQQAMAARLTEEQRQAEAVSLAAAIAESERVRKEARERAKELLLSKLSPEQKKTFSDNGWFIVEGGRTKTKYRIRSNSYAGNIDVLDVSNKVLYRLCVHCSGDFPLEDHLVSQKIMLELAEDDIVRLANHYAA